MENKSAGQITVNGITLNLKTPKNIHEAVRAGDYPLRILLYGRSGTGKSTMANTVPGKKFVIDTDNGAIPYTGDCVIAQIPEDLVSGASASVGKLGVAPIAWKMACAAMDQAVQDPSVKVIITDCFSSLVEACMAQVMYEYGRPAPTWVEWGKRITYLKQYVITAFKSGKHVVNIFHEDVDKDDLTGQTWNKPLIGGKFGEAVPGLHDEVYHMEPQKTGNKIEYRARTKATSLYVAKSRLDSLITNGLNEHIPADVAEIQKRLCGGGFTQRATGLGKALASLVF